MTGLTTITICIIFVKLDQFMTVAKRTVCGVIFDSYPLKRTTLCRFISSAVLIGFIYNEFSFSRKKSQKETIPGIYCREFYHSRLFIDLLSRWKMQVYTNGDIHTVLVAAIHSYPWYFTSCSELANGIMATLFFTSSKMRMIFVEKYNSRFVCVCDYFSSRAFLHC